MQYIERDISWIDFNDRVLSQIGKPNVPLKECFNFLSITASNLDEYFMVRLAKYRTLKEKHPDDRRISDTFRLMIKESKKFIIDQEIGTMELFQQVRKEGYKFVSSIEELNAEEKDIALDYVIDHVKPKIKFTERIIGMHVNMLIEMVDGEKRYISLDNHPRFINVAADDNDVVYISIDKVIKNFINNIAEKQVKNCVAFRIIRDGFYDVSESPEEDVDLLIAKVIKERNNTKPIVLEFEMGADIETLRGLVDDDTIIIPRQFLAIDKFNKINLSKLKGYESFVSKNPPILKDKNIFKVLDKQDVILQHPFDDYNPVIDLIQKASVDKSVTSIKQTLYRVSSVDSPIVEALCEAARNKKRVDVLVEVKARFSESVNLEIIKKMKKSGVNVIKTDKKIKVHAKTLLITKKVKYGQPKHYAHLGTGNYNENTSKFYTDISLLTSNEEICEDINNLFKALSHKKSIGKMNKISVGQNIRKDIFKEIDTLIEECRENEMLGEKNTAKCIFKVNAINDIKVVEKIYQAAEAGVKIEIICRGACSIVAGKNIKIKSVVGRFLEHSRIYYFINNCGVEKAFISSADLLTRNLERRIEIMTPVEGDVLTRIERILELYKKDKANSFKMREDGTWKMLSGNKSVHDALMTGKYYIKKKKNDTHLNSFLHELFTEEDSFDEVENIEEDIIQDNNYVDSDIETIHLAPLYNEVDVDVVCRDFLNQTNDDIIEDSDEVDELQEDIHDIHDVPVINCYEEEYIEADDDDDDDMTLEEEIIEADKAVKRSREFMKNCQPKDRLRYIEETKGLEKYLRELLVVYNTLVREGKIER